MSIADVSTVMIAAAITAAARTRIHSALAPIRSSTKSVKAYVATAVQRNDNSRIGCGRPIATSAIMPARIPAADSATTTDTRRRSSGRASLSSAARISSSCRTPSLEQVLCPPRPVRTLE